MSFLAHLDVLRKHLIRAVIAVLLTSTLAFIFSDFLFDFVLLIPKSPDFITNQLLCQAADYFETPELCINQQDFEIMSSQMSGQFSVTMMVAIYAGIIAAFPFIIYQLWAFIKPALYPKEQKQTRGAVFFISICFLIGVLFGYFIIVPLSIHFLSTWSASEIIVNRIDLNSYFSTVAYIPLSTGIVFELPVLLIFLTKCGIVSPNFLAKYRRHAYVLLLILSAIITPPDVFSMILVVLPLALLYEISILLARRAYKKQSSKELTVNK